MSDADQCTSEREAPARVSEMNRGFTQTSAIIFAVACGAMVANLYYAQPLISIISSDLGMRRGLAGLIVTLTQIGYGVGLLLIVPLGDLLENRRLVLTTTGCVVLGLVGVAFSSSATLFLASYFIVGVFSVGAQILMPLAAHLTPSASRGRVIGNVMAGLIAGIMLARPAASFFAANLGWRSIFWASIALMLIIMGLLWRSLPSRKPETSMSYRAVIISTLQLLWTERVLRQRALYQGVFFAIFNLFWTAAPMALQDTYHLTQRGIGLVALAGAGGALAAPLAGRAADRGWTRSGTALAMLGAVLAFLVSGWAAGAGALTAFIIAAVVLDAATQSNHILGQRLIYGLAADARSRMNAGYVSVMFMFGAAGSATAALIYVHFGWFAVCMIGAALGVANLIVFVGIDRRSEKPRSEIAKST